MDKVAVYAEISAALIYQQAEARILFDDDAIYVVMRITRPLQHTSAASSGVDSRSGRYCGNFSFRNNATKRGSPRSESYIAS